MRLTTIKHWVAVFVLGVLPFAKPCSAQSAFNINLDAVRRSVVFLHIVDSRGQLKEAGTGFLLLVPTKSDPNKGYLLLVTARHIVDPQWAGCPATNDTLVAVFNKKGFDPKKETRGTVEVPLSRDWMFPDDDSADVAVTILNGRKISKLNVENQPIRISELPSPQEVDRVNTGAQVVSAGLLLGASGTERNYPIFKFGYVSSVPDEKVSVACCPGCVAHLQHDWMIAASLVPGNSGSPIFFVPVGFPGISAGGQRAFLLGVQSVSYLGSDVAGMAPVEYLWDAIRKLNLSDANLPTFGNTATPSSAHPPNPAVPSSIPH
ncbi:MAG TPA: hypothetical protein VMU92_00980 [Acidobacteriaceae bacterium]|nr:hypothetical protein [Acidobacteriaceae bacterium]